MPQAGINDLREDQPAGVVSGSDKKEPPVKESGLYTVPTGRGESDGLRSREDSGAATVRAVTIDPVGYVVLRFGTWDERASFLSSLAGKVSGSVFGQLRTDPSGSSVTLKLSDFVAPFDLPLTAVDAPQASQHKEATNAATATQSSGSELERIATVDCANETAIAAICGSNPILPAARLGCGKPITKCREVYRCADCRAPFHHECIQNHFAIHAKQTANSKANELADWLFARYPIPQINVEELEQFFLSALKQASVLRGSGRG